MNIPFIVDDIYSFYSDPTERRKYFDKIRKEGDFSYNRRSEDDIVVRESNKPTQTSFLPCPFCSGYYSVKNLRHHIRLTCLHNSKSKCSFLGQSIVKGSYIHKLACDSLKNLIYPSIRNPQAFRLLTTDTTAVLYGNNLAEMYLTISQHHAKMIAAQIRLLAKIFFQIQLVNPALKEIKDIFCPKQYNNLVKAIKLMAGFDGKKYTTPSVVHSACILIKNLGIL